MLTLHYWNFSPYSLKVKKALDYLGLRYEARSASLIDRSHLKRITGRTSVPVIEDNSLALRDSTAILQWLDDNHRRGAFYPESVGIINRVIEDWADETLLQTLYPLKFSVRKIGTTVFADYGPVLANLAALSTRHDARRRFPGSRSDHLAKLDQQLQYLDRMLDSDQFLFGPRPIAADFAVYGMLKAAEPVPGLALIRERENIANFIDSMDSIQEWSVSCAS